MGIRDGVGGGRGRREATDERSRIPLLGRDWERAALQAELRAVSGGWGRAVLIEGEGGIGKTRLLDEVSEMASAMGVAVLRGAAEELERERPFGAIADALNLSAGTEDPDRAAIGRLLSGGDDPVSGVIWGPDQPSQRFRIVDAITALVERLCAARPVALVIDDLHWADPSTLVVMARLARRLDFLGLAILTAFRPLPRSSELERLLAGLASVPGKKLTLDRLDDDSVAALVARLVDGEPGPALIREATGAGGNPLFVTELVGALDDEGLITDANGRMDLRETALPPSLRLTVLRRVSLLPKETVGMLRLASVLGSTFTLSDLAAVAGRPASELVALLEPALASGVIGEQGDRLAFRHDLVRESIYQDLPASARGALHLQAGRALAEAGAPARQVAVHLAAGAARGDGEAIEWLRRAAREAAARDSTIAAGFLRRALELASGTDSDVAPIAAELARSLLWSGRLEEAEAVIRELLDQPQPAELSGSLHYSLGRVLAYRGRLLESIAQVERALDVPGLPERERASLLADVSHRYLFCGDFKRARAAATEAITASDRLGNELGHCSALCALSWLAEVEGRTGEAVRLAQDGLNRDHHGAVEPVQLVQPRLYLGMALIGADRLIEAREQLQQGRHQSEELGTSWALPLHHYGLALCAFHSGAWDEAIAEAETSIALGLELETRVWIVAARGVLAQIAFARDDFARALREVEAAEREVAAASSPQFEHWRIACTKALVRAGQGDLNGAVVSIRAGETLPPHSAGPHREIAPDLVRLALAAGDADLASEISRSGEQTTSGSDLPAMRATADRCRGLIDDDADVLCEAVSNQHGSPRRYERATACLDAGAALARAGRNREAEALVREALEHLEHLGAARGIDSAEALLRSLGVRRGRRGPRRRAKSGWDSLTATERRIAALVAEGLSNPEIGERLFVSRRTVETHVSHSFVKLGLSSRAQLAAEATRREHPQETR